MDGVEGARADIGRLGPVQRLRAAIGGKAHRGDVAQHWHAVEKRVAMDGEVSQAPLPLVDVGSLLGRDAVERALERAGDDVVAGLRALCAAVVAPAGLVAQDAQHQGDVRHRQRGIEFVAQFIADQSTLQFGEPGRVDQRLRAAGQHEVVPASQQVVHLGRPGSARRGPEQDRRHLERIEREIVGLYGDHAVDRMALDLAQELPGASLAIGLGPVAADEVAVVVRHHAGVGVDQDAAGRIVGARQRIERHEARPVVLARPARHRHRAVALAPHWHARRRDQPGVSGRIGIDDVLHRRDDLAGGGQEFVPVLGEAEAGESFTRRIGAVEGSRLEGEHMARGREAGHVRIFAAAGDEVVDDHAVPGLAHPQRDGLAPQDVDRLVADRERAGAVRRDVAAGIGRIDPLDEQILAVEIGRGEAPADGAVVAEHDGG